MALSRRPYRLIHECGVINGTPMVKQVLYGLLETGRMLERAGAGNTVLCVCHVVGPGPPHQHDHGAGYMRAGRYRAPSPCVHRGWHAR